MPKGGSGRIVVELDPSLKRQLYSALAMENKTLKDWVLERIELYLGGHLEADKDKKDGKS